MMHYLSSELSVSATGKLGFVDNSDGVLIQEVFTVSIKSGSVFVDDG